MGTSLGFSSFYGVNLLLVQCYSMLSAAGSYSNGLNCILYSRVGPVMLGPAEMVVPLVYSYLPMIVN